MDPKDINKICLYMAYYTGYSRKELLDLIYDEFIELYNDARKMFDEKPKKGMK